MPICPEQVNGAALGPAIAGRLLRQFRAAVAVDWRPAEDLRAAVVRLASALPADRLKPAPERRRVLAAAANDKLKVNYAAFRDVLDTAAAHRAYFNYHEKVAIQRQLDTADRAGFVRLLDGRRDLGPAARAAALAAFRPASAAGSGAALRSAARADPQADAILHAVFRAFVFGCYPVELVHRYFSGIPAHEPYRPRFYDYLTGHYPAAFRRDCGLIYLVVDDAFVAAAGGARPARDALAAALRAAHDRLANHCVLALLITPLRGPARALPWELYADAVLFAEKFRAVKLTTGYFHPRKVAAATVRHIPGLDESACRFELAHEGFYYKDCFCVRYEPGQPAGSPDAEFDLLVLFEKNERDETPIPCPACRSLDIRGNSYPVLGVRSWECQNPLCPERSKYDRGNRYSLASLIKQEAIECEAADIPPESLRRWKRDIVTAAGRADVLEMLVRHYTLVGDPVDLVNTPAPAPVLHGRRLYTDRWVPPPADAGLAGRLFRGPYFERFGLDLAPPPTAKRFANLAKWPGVEVYHGDAAEVLRQLGDASVDAAATSPPYYNAKSYASWPNIYCYWHDMAVIARQVFRVLKPGAPYLFNLFDYFDNENNIVFSAMGKKRMTLGAYAIHLFRRIGFVVAGNVIWDKGEIEGKRGFNGGNASPYYQSPFNCWEHVLIFTKGRPARRWADWSCLLRTQPVVKMVRGENVLGHDAPFPEAVPALVLDRMRPGETVLDPFAGSLTTARAAWRRGLRSISIDYKQEYCELGLRLLAKDADQPSLFA